MLLQKTISTPTIDSHLKDLPIMAWIPGPRSHVGYSSGHGHSRKNVLADDFMQEVEEEEVGLTLW